MKLPQGTERGVKTFEILLAIGILGLLIDGVATIAYFLRGGVAGKTLWQYVSTFPGNLFTALWLVPWAGAIVCLHLQRQTKDVKSS
jgi:hypothetical protein